MPIQRRSTPTIAGVARHIVAFETRYALDSRVFLARDSRSSHVDEDDAMQWSYLCEQLKVLREDALEVLYSVPDDAVLENFEDSREQLAA